MQWLRRSLSKLISTAPNPYWFIPAPEGSVAIPIPVPVMTVEKRGVVPMKIGDHVRTNARYAKEISRTPRMGVLLKPLTWTAGGWVVRLEGFEKPQYIHKRYMEVIK